MKNEDYFYNAHTHVFTFDNVPDRFLKRVFPLLGMINVHAFRTSKFFRFLRKGLREVICWSDTDILDRLVNFLEHGQGKNMPESPMTQEGIFNNLQSYYPPGTRFIVLSMDMEYMGAGKVSRGNYASQLKGLKALRKKHKKLIHPFIFVDPRRLNDNDDVKCLKGQPFWDYTREKLTKAKFAGIKIYPALGYWPFSIAMKEVYDFATKNNIPLLSHCSGGPVYYRGRKIDKIHPIDSDIKLKGYRNKYFTRHYSNPLNYNMLMDKNLLTKLWEDKAEDYSSLKICLGHFGGRDEWMDYLQNPWLSPYSLKNSNSYPSLEKKNWCFDIKRKNGKYTWFSAICDLIKKYENVYADISSTLHDERIYPLLKILLETNEKFRTRILFGTDFYMVALNKSEKEFSIGLRSFLGEELFHQIAFTNVKTFLSSKFYP